MAARSTPRRADLAHDRRGPRRDARLETAPEPGGRAGRRGERRARGPSRASRARSRGFLPPSCQSAGPVRTATPATSSSARQSRKCCCASNQSCGPRIADSGREIVSKASRAAGQTPVDRDRVGRLPGRRARRSPRPLSVSARWGGLARARTAVDARPRPRGGREEFASGTSATSRPEKLGSGQARPRIPPHGAARRDDRRARAQPGRRIMTNAAHPDRRATRASPPSGTTTSARVAVRRTASRHAVRAWSLSTREPVGQADPREPATSLHLAGGGALAPLTGSSPRVPPAPRRSPRGTEVATGPGRSAAARTPARPRAGVPLGDRRGVGPPGAASSRSRGAPQQPSPDTAATAPSTVMTATRSRAPCGRQQTRLGPRA